MAFNIKKNPNRVTSKTIQEHLRNSKRHLISKTKRPMKIFSVISFLFSLIFVCLIGCKDYDLEQIDFVQISIVSDTLIGIDSVRLSAKIEGLVTGKPVKYGFLYKLQDEPVPLEFGEKITLGETKRDTTFETTLNLDPYSQYNIAAFAETTEGVLLLDSLPLFNTGRPSVSTKSYSYFGGFQIELKGRLKNTNVGAIAVKHGFCWGYQIDGAPVLQDTNFIDLGNRSNDETFTAHPHVFQPEDDGTPFLFRAFAVFSFNFQLDTVYDENCIEFDGDINYWLPVASLEEGWQRDVAFSFESNGLGYFGGGHLGPSLLQFNPNDGIFGSWTDISNSYTSSGDPIECSYTNITRRAAAITFTIGNKGYVGLGFCSDADQKKLRDLWEFESNGASQTLTRVKEDFPGERRVAAVGLSIGNKGYIGLGKVDGSLQNDFYEFDPSGGSSGQEFWKEMEEFPNSILKSAIGFSIGGKGYIGLGEDNEKFYEFDPNGGDDDNDGKNGKWRELEKFPMGIRRDPVGFGMGNKGYVGLGRHDIYYSDFYEFDPNGGIIDSNGLPKGTWTRIADYPGSGRTLGEGFVIDEKIYLGAGKIEGPPCELGLACEAIDFWVFHR